MKNKHYGFTLIEIAIVIAIIGIITTALLTGMGAMRETAKFKEDQRKLQDIKSALLSYAAVNGNLPCPDTDNDGLENRTDGHCTATSGNLPFNSLQTHAINAYGFGFSYHINREANTEANVKDPTKSASYFGLASHFGADCFNDRQPSTCFDMQTPPTASNPIDENLGNYRISDGTNPITNQVPLVVISHGKDYKEGSTCNGNSNFENWNCDLSQTEDNQVLLYQAQQGENFDDAIIWLTSLEIKKITPGILNNISQNSNNNNAQSQQLAFIPITPADDVSSITFDQTIQGDVGFSSNGNNDDTIKINGDLTSEASLGNGTDILYVLGDVNATLIGGNQSKTIYIDGDQNASISLGGGSVQHKIHITGHSNANISTGTSSNTDLIIEKNITATINLGGTNNSVFIGGDITGTIYGDGIIYINKTYNQITTTEFNQISGSFSTTGNAKCRVSMQTTTWRNCEPL